MWSFNISHHCFPFWQAAGSSWPTQKCKFHQNSFLKSALIIMRMCRCLNCRRAFLTLRSLKISRTVKPMVTSPMMAINIDSTPLPAALFLYAAGLSSKKMRKIPLLEMHLDSFHLNCLGQQTQQWTFSYGRTSPAETWVRNNQSSFVHQCKFKFSSNSNS